MSFKLKKINIFYGKESCNSGGSKIETNKKKEKTNNIDFSEYKNLDETDKNRLNEISGEGDESSMTQVFIENNKDYFKDSIEKKLILKSVDKYTIEIINNLKDKFPELKNIENDNKKLLYDLIKYNILQNSIEDLDEDFTLGKKMNEEDTIKDEDGYIINGDEINNNQINMDIKNSIKNNIKNIFKINKKELKENYIDTITTDLYSNIQYSDPDVKNYNTFDKNNEIDKHYSFLKLRELTKNKGGDIIDYSKGISKKYISIISNSYLDKGNFPIFARLNNNKISNGLKEKLTPNEIIALTIIFSGQEEQVKNIEGNNFITFLQKLGNKFNSNFDGNITDIDNFKKTIISAAFPQNTIPYIKGEKMYKSFLDIAKDSNFTDIRHISGIKVPPVGQSISKKEKDKINQFFENNVLKSKNKDKFINDFNEVFGQFGINKTKDNAEKIQKENTLNMLAILRGIKNIDITTAVNTLSNIPGINKVNQNGDNFSDNIGELLKPDNINKILYEYNKSKNKDPIQFLKYYFKEKGIYDFIKEGKNKQYESKDKIYDNFVKKFMEIIKNNLKRDNLKEELDILDDNKKFSKYVNKFFNKISPENIPILKDSGTINKENIKEGVKTNLELTLIELMTKKGVYTLDKKFLQNNKEELLNKFIENNKTLQLDKKVLSEIFDNFTKKFSGSFNFNKEKIEKIKNQLNIEKSFIEESDKVETLGYSGYVEYKEKQENEKELLENMKEPLKESVNIEDTPFADKNTPENDIKTIYKEKNGVHTAYVKIPGEKNILKISDLTKEGVNKELINTYLSKQFNLNIDLKGNDDQFNQIFENNLDIGKDDITENSFKQINKLFQTHIHESFFKNPGKNEKKLIEKHNLNPYDMYKNPYEFSKKFSNMLKETNEINISGMKYDGSNYILDLNDSKSISPETFGKTNQEKIKEEVLDNKGKKKKTKEEKKGILKEISEETTSFFGKTYNKIKSYFTY